MANIFVVSAPSGGGKTSLVNAVLEQLNDIKLSISYTTRPLRPGEEDGKNYHFVSADRFAKMIEEGKFLEHAKVFGNDYGTSRTEVENALELDLDVILEIDWQGAKQIKDNFPQAVLVFLLPPSLEILAERLRNRASDSEEVIHKRLQEAEMEISNYGLFDHLLVNDDFDRTLLELTNLIEAFRAGQKPQDSKRENQEIKLASLLAKLTAEVD